MSEAKELISTLKEEQNEPDDSKITLSIFRKDMERLRQITRFLNYEGNTDLTNPEVVSILITQFANVFPKSVK